MLDGLFVFRVSTRNLWVWLSTGMWLSQQLHMWSHHWNLLLQSRLEGYEVWSRWAFLIFLNTHTFLSTWCWHQDILVLKVNLCKDYTCYSTFIIWTCNKSSGKKSLYSYRHWKDIHFQFYTLHAQLCDVPMLLHRQAIQNWERFSPYIHLNLRTIIVEYWQG